MPEHATPSCRPQPDPSQLIAWRRLWEKLLRIPAECPAGPIPGEGARDGDTAKRPA